MSDDGNSAAATPEPEVGLCSTCRWARSNTNTRGSSFWQCRRAEQDPKLLRYPPLPVTSCHGFERGEPG